jgi:hypothetical protein
MDHAMTRWKPAHFPWPTIHPPPPLLLYLVLQSPPWSTFPPPLFLDPDNQ